MKIAVLLSNLLPKELNFVVGKEINRVNYLGANASIFSMNLSFKLMDIFGPVLHQSHLPFFSNGVAIATDFHTNNLLNITPLNADKFYYAYDLDWLYKPIQHSFVYNSISKSKILVRSELHKKYFKNIFSLDTQVVPFNLELIWNSQDRTKISSFKPM